MKERNEIRKEGKKKWVVFNAPTTIKNTMCVVLEHFHHQVHHHHAGGSLSMEALVKKKCSKTTYNSQVTWGWPCMEKDGKHVMAFG